VRFLLDVCSSSRSLEGFLLGRGDDVVSVVSINPKARDEDVMNAALREDRVLITEDKDYGELVFVRRLPHGPIIRLVELTVDEQVQALGEFLDQRGSELHGPVLVTISRTRVRVRRAF
jgi:predicted nuclease of predicted toxin-antitoxin system